MAKSTRILEDAVQETANRLALELADLPARQGIAAHLSQEPGTQTDRMAMAIVANACTFHAMIAGFHDAVPDLADLRTGSGALPRDRVLDSWRQILDIDYYPIFKIAADILRSIPSGVASQVLDRLAHAADELSAEGATKSHDLTGRMFQKLIQDRKFLATFYTRPESAALLADLAVGSMERDWTQGMTGIRVADFACGTGTLLSAAYHALIPRHRRAGRDDREDHASMIEESLIACDIMPAATHLTASMLSSAHPAEGYEGTQVYTLPYRAVAKRVDLGALSLLGTEPVHNLLGTGLAGRTERHRGKVKKESEAEDERGGESFAVAVADGSVDLVIMNPPFTRPTNHEVARESVPSFAGFGKTTAEQKAMSAELKRLRNQLARKRRAKGNSSPASDGNAGLGSNFVDLAHEKLKPGGTLALVLPATFALGDAWKASRRLLGSNYRNIRVVSIATAHSSDTSFSADTGMAEILVVAEKRHTQTKAKAHRAPTAWVLLERRPRSLVEAVQTARVLRRELERPWGDVRKFEVTLGCQRIAGGIRATLGDGGCAGISDLAVAESAMSLAAGRLPLPRTGESLLFLTASLGELAGRGPVDRDVGGKPSGREPRGPFTISPLRGVPDFPVLWGHDARRERRLVVEPDSMGSVRTGQESKAQKVWQTASRLHFNRDFRVNAQSLAACLTPTPAIGGAAWPAFRTHESGWEKALVAWANTTLGLLLFWWIGSTQQSGRTRITVKRLPHLPVLDLREVPEESVTRIGEAFDEIADRDLLPAHRAFEDPARIELDRLVLERALGFGAAGMEQVALLREKWCAEPTVHGGKRPGPA